VIIISQLDVIDQTTGTNYNNINYIL